MQLLQILCGMEVRRTLDCLPDVKDIDRMTNSTDVRKVMGDGSGNDRNKKKKTITYVFGVKHAII